MKSIRDIMQCQLVFVREHDSVHRAIELLIENNISGLPVIDSDGHLIGMLSEKNLLRVLYDPDARSVESVMNREAVCFSVDAPLVDVVDCLMANDFRRVFIHEHRTLVGLVSRADLMPAILEALLERS